jgi:SAM-dependent methyltransferase
MAFTRKPKWAIVGSHLFHNFLMEARARFGFVKTDHGATHLNWSTEESVRYIRQVFADYETYGGLDTTVLHGARVLEIGPGDNLGVALLFIAHGAAEVVCLDKFFSRRETDQQIRIYRALRNTLNDQQKERFDSAVQLNDDLRFFPSRVRLVCGTGIEEADQAFPPGSFDLIVSRAVLMEVHNPDRAFAVMDRVLAPGGFSIHKVSPLNDYRMFRGNGYHPLEFLTVPEGLYCRMAAGSGKPNRRLRSYYERRLTELGYATSIQVAKVLGSSELLPPGTISIARGTEAHRQALAIANEIRPRLCERFRSSSDDDLIAEDLFVVGRKLSSGARVLTHTR